MQIKKGFKNILNLGLIFSFTFVFSFGVNKTVLAKEVKKQLIETDLEKIKLKKGLIIEKITIPVGDTIEPDYVNEIELDVLIINTVQTKEIDKGLLITGKINITNYKERGATFINYNDIEEILNAIKYIKSVANNWKEISKEKTELKFSSKNNLEIGFYQEKLKQTFFCNIGNSNKILFEFNKSDGMEEFNKMELQIKKAFEILKNRNN